MMVKVFFSRFVMGRLGRDPAFFDHVEGGPSAQVARLTRKALVDQDPSVNPYLHWILNGTHGEALPRALELERFETIRDRLDRLEIRLCTVETLAEEGVKADAFNLSDIFEYMSPEAHETGLRHDPRRVAAGRADRLLEHDGAAPRAGVDGLAR